MTYFTLCLTAQCILWFYCHFFTISVKVLFNQRHLSVRLIGLRYLSDFIILIWGKRNLYKTLSRALYDYCYHFSIGSGNGLTPNRWEVIIWTYDGKFTDAYMRHSASMSFNEGVGGVCNITALTKMAVYGSSHNESATSTGNACGFCGCQRLRLLCHRKLGGGSVQL